MPVAAASVLVLLAAKVRSLASEPVVVVSSVPPSSVTGPSPTPEDTCVGPLNALSWLMLTVPFWIVVPPR